MAITAFYASLLALLFILLSARVIAQRREAKVEIGHGESAQLLRRMRVHANFAEYVPFALLLMTLAESLRAPALNSAPNAPPPMPQTSTSSQSIVVFAITELVPK